MLVEVSNSRNSTYTHWEFLSVTENLQGLKLHLMSHVKSCFGNQSGRSVLTMVIEATCYQNVGLWLSFQGLQRILFIHCKSFRCEYEWNMSLQLNFIISECYISLLFTSVRCWDSMVSIARRLQEGLGIESWQGLEIFLFSKKFVPILGYTQSLLQWVLQLGHGVDHSPPASAEVMYE
jgi:hypothetical protein